jgi:hypothetical protein
MRRFDAQIIAVNGLPPYIAANGIIVNFEDVTVAAFSPDDLRGAISAVAETLFIALLIYANKLDMDHLYLFLLGKSDDETDHSIFCNRDRGAYRHEQRRPDVQRHMQIQPDHSGAVSFSSGVDRPEIPAPPGMGVKRCWNS